MVQKKEVMRNSLKKLTVTLATASAWLAFTVSPAQAQYRETSLTDYLPGMGHYLDTKLNGWGMVIAPDGSFCVANTATGVGTFYDQSGKPLAQVITIPAAPSHPFGPLGTPTGLVRNPTSGFVISKNGRSAPAIFLFNSLDGTISGWNPDVDQDAAVTIQDNSGAGALYTGVPWVGTVTDKSSCMRPIGARTGSICSMPTLTLWGHLATEMSSVNYRVTMYSVSTMKMASSM